MERLRRPSPSLSVTGRHHITGHEEGQPEDFLQGVRASSVLPVRLVQVQKVR
jgi:hypothetical protein